jgi:hypothetical protein
MLAQHNGCRAYDDQECPGCATTALVESLVAAVRSIAHGPLSGPEASPGGLEALAMSLAGSGNYRDDNLAQAVRDAGEAIGSGLRAIPEAVAS